jgi:type II secretory pathway pseudopilin PulG
MRSCLLLVLAALAAPAFAATIPDAKGIQAALNAAAPAKLAVAETYSRTGHWVASNDEAGFATPTGAATITIGQAGVITIAFDGPIITLTPTADHDQVRWACSTTGLPTASIPAGCH